MYVRTSREFSNPSFSTSIMSTDSESYDIQVKLTTWSRVTKKNKKGPTTEWKKDGKGKTKDFEFEFANTIENYTDLLNQLLVECDLPWKATATRTFPMSVAVPPAGYVIYFCLRRSKIHFSHHLAAHEVLLTSTNLQITLNSSRRFPAPSLQSLLSYSLMSRILERRSFSRYVVCCYCLLCYLSLRHFLVALEVIRGTGTGR
jgi:hypothetical protein